MNMREEVTLTRNADAVMIPSGERVLIPEGAHATITQSLGGSYTLITDRGLMVRVSGKEVEAIGKTPENVADVKEGEELTPEKLDERRPGTRGRTSKRSINVAQCAPTAGPRNR